MESSLSYVRLIGGFTGIVILSIGSIFTAHQVVIHANQFGMFALDNQSMMHTLILLVSNTGVLAFVLFLMYRRVIRRRTLSK